MNVASSETVSFLRPLARRAANTLRPLAVAILVRNPCLLILLRRDGWKVLFIAIAISFFIVCCYPFVFPLPSAGKTRAEGRRLRSAKV